MDDTVEIASMKSRVAELAQRIKFILDTTPLDEDSYHILDMAQGQMVHLAKHGSTEWEGY
jgi:hypothetical protein